MTGGGDRAGVPSGRVAIGAAVVAVHLALSLVHGVAHATIPVHVPVWQYVVAVVAILSLPVVAVALVAAGRRAGAWLLLAGALVSAAFEGLLHFVVANPDHVAHVTDGTAVFATTALLSTVGDVALVAVAGWLLWRQRQGSSTSSRIESTA